MHQKKIGLMILAAFLVGFGLAQASDQAVGPIVTSAGYSPVLLTSVPDYPFGVAVPPQGQTIYFTGQDGLYYYAGGSGGLAVSDPGLTACRFRPKWGCFAGDSSGNIYRLNVNAGSEVLLGSVPGFLIPGIDIDPANGDIYFTAIRPLLPPAVRVYKLRQGGQAPRLVASLSTMVTGITVVGSSLYVAATYGGEVLRLPKTGGTPRPVISGPFSPADITADPAGNLYFSDMYGGAIYAVKKGTNRAVSIASGFNYPFGIGVDAKGNIYFVENYGPAGLWMLRRSFS